MKIAITRRRKIAIGSLLLLAVVWMFWPDRTLARVRSLRSDLTGAAGKARSPQERDAKAKQLRETMQKLSPEQRQELFADARKRGNDEMERYHQLSPAEKRQHLDQQIKRQEEFRQRMQQQPPGQSNAGP